MAEVKFLSNLNVDGNIDLNQGQLIDSRFQVVTTDPTSGNFEGRMIYRSDIDAIKFYNGSSWKTLSTTTGDITAVIAGTGLTGGGTSGSVTLNVVGGDGITANANEIEVAVDGTTIELSASNGSGVVRAKTAAITNGGSALATADQIHTFVTTRGYLTGNQTITLSGDVTGSGTTSITTTIASGAVEAGMLNDGVISDHTSVTSLASTDEFLVYDASAGANRSSTMSTLQTYMQNNLTFTSNTDVDVSKANLKTRLAQMNSTDTVYIGDADDDTTVVIRGTLQVDGATITTNSETVTFADNILLLNSNAAATPTENAGLEVERGNSTNVLFRWNEASDRWEFTNNGSTYYNIPISTEYNNYSHPTQTAIDVNAGSTEVIDRVVVNTLGHVTSVVKRTFQSASTSAKGIVELATSGEALAGTDSTRAVTPAGLAARSYKGTIGDGSATSIAVSHGLGTRDVMVQMYDASSYDTVFAQVVRTDASTVTVDFNTAPAANDIIILITKID